MASNRARPALKDLLDSLGEVYEWETLGINLGIKKYKLQEIKAERRDKMTLCKMDMFDYWLRSNVHASWEKIVMALEKMDNEYNDLAHSLRVKYKLGPSPAARVVPAEPMEAQPQQSYSSGVHQGGPHSTGATVPVSSSVEESGVAQSSNLSKVVDTLTGKDIDVNTVDKESGYYQSILQKVVQLRDLNYVKVLVALGADVNYADKKGNTAFDIASQGNYHNIQELLSKVGGRPFEFLDPSSSMESSSEFNDEMRLQKLSNVLCLDSSTEKVVVQLEVLNRIEMMTGRKITDLFEYIVGSGMGGLLLLAMVYAKKSVSELKKLYYQLWQRLHLEPNTKKKWRVLEDFTHGLFGSSRMEDVESTKDSTNKILIAAVNRETTQLKQQFFTNFSEGRNSRLHVYRVACYTCATPEYYSVINSDTDNYIHGGAICRNLTASALTFIAENCERPSISGVVSVGRGIWPAQAFTDQTDLSACAMEALVEQVHENCKSRFITNSPTFYYRVNPLLPEQTPVTLQLEDLIDLQINTIAALIGEESAATELFKLADQLKS